MIDQANETSRPPIELITSPAHTVVITQMPVLECLFQPRADCAQLSMSPFAAEAAVLDIGHIRLVTHRSKTSFRVRRRARPGHFTIGYANSTDPLVRCGRQCAFGDLIAIGEDDADIALLGASDFAWVDVDTAAMDDDRLLRLLPLLRRGAVLKPADARRSQELRGYVAAVMQMCAADPFLVRNPAMRAELQKGLQERLVRALTDAKESLDTATEQKTWALVQHVERFMWENVEEPITLRRICEATHSSLRSLIYCFSRTFGLGPIAYLKIRRLEAAHRRLLETRGKARITDVAADFGFWHMGHFGADYKRMFGSTASQTLEAARAFGSRVRSRSVDFGLCASRISRAPIAGVR